MTREIKFRAWVVSLDNGEGEMIDVATAGPSLNDPERVFDIKGQKYKDDWFTISPLMQYTGLKDKNGVEIYEGDIVKYIGQLNPDRYKLFIIEWDDKLAGFYAGGGQIQRTKGYEVIGNIYETPELLDKN